MANDSGKQTKIYAKSLSTYIEALLTGILGLGFTILAYEYVQIAISDSSPLNQSDFIARLVLLFGLVLFAAYDTAIYKILVKEITDEISMRGNIAIISRFILDIMQVLIMALMLGIFHISDAFSVSPGDLPIENDMHITRKMLYALLLLSFSWHIVIMLWHVTTESAMGAKCEGPATLIKVIWHIFLMLILVGGLAFLYCCGDLLDQADRRPRILFLFVVIYIFYIVMIYAFRVWPVVRRHSKLKEYRP